MNPWQVLQQLRATIVAAKWPDADTLPVVGAVAISTPEAYLANEGALSPLPVAIVTEGDADDDAEAPERTVARFDVHLLAEVMQSPLGDASIAGGSRSGGLGSSEGRGVAEIDEAVRAAIAAMDPRFRLNVRTTRSVAAKIPIEDRILAQRTFAVEVTGGRDRYYHPPRRLRAGAVVASAFALSWDDPPARWDTLGGAAGPAVIAIRYAAGATAPASVTSGTALGTYALGVGTAAVSLGAGTFSFSAFCQYDENLDGTADRWSIAGAGSQATVAA